MLANNTGDLNIDIPGREALVKSKVYVNATLVKATGEVIAKIVHAGAAAREISLQIRGLPKPPTGGREIVLTGPDLNAGNSFDSPENVVPIERPLTDVGDSFMYELKPHSFTILRLTP
jgi:alpha-L-arabinofuranosidase